MVDFVFFSVLVLRGLVRLSVSWAQHIAFGLDCLLLCLGMGSHLGASFGGLSVWDDAALVACEDIFEHSQTGRLVVGSVGDLRGFLDAAIVLNFDVDDRSFEARYASWRDVGAAAVLLASRLGIVLNVGLVQSVLVKKQRDYGHENIRRFGSQGLYVRLHDKVARLENLLLSGATPENESLQDNVMDVVGYCAIGCMWEADKFLLPVSEGAFS